MVSCSCQLKPLMISVFLRVLTCGADFLTRHLSFLCGRSFLLLLLQAMSTEKQQQRSECSVCWKILRLLFLLSFFTKFSLIADNSSFSPSAEN